MARPKHTGGAAKQLSNAEISRIDKCLSGTRFELRNRCLFYITLGSGMRIGEASQLLVKDVRPNGEILKEITLTKWNTKSKRSRTVYLSRQAHEHLTAYLDSRGDNLTADAPLFPTQKTKHKPMSPNVAAQIMGKIIKENAGISGASSHSARKTFANRMRKDVAGADVFLIKELLGHRSLATTQKYFVLDADRAKDTVAKLKF